MKRYYMDFINNTEVEDENGAWVYFNDVDNKIKKLQTKNESNLGWISVTDRLPDKPYETYLVCSHNDCVFNTTFMPDKTWYDDAHGIITHWMPLPKPPKREI